VKFDYSLIPDPMEKFEKWGIDVTDKIMDSIVESRKQIEADIRDFESGGGFGSIFMWLESHRCFAFIVDNYEPLRERGIFEAALYEAFQATNINNSNIQRGVISAMLNLADREKLLSMGDPLPEDKEVYTLFRGIAGKGAARRKYGHSWTGNFDKAKWFAERLFFDKPMVYRADVPKDCICFYTDERNEDEYVCLIPRGLKLVEVWRQEKEVEVTS